jgi:hypothetical protein
MDPHLQAAHAVCTELLDLLAKPLSADSVANGWTEEARKHFYQRIGALNDALAAGDIAVDPTRYRDMSIPREMDNWGITPQDSLMDRAAVLSQHVRAVARSHMPESPQA